MHRVVVGVDGSSGSQVALRWALDEARRRGAVVDVVHAWHMPFLMPSPMTPVTTIDVDPLEKTARAVLDHAVQSEDTVGLEVTPLLVCDAPARALIEAAKGADMLVVGARGRGGFTGLLLGSVSHAVTYHAPCPVVVVPPAR